jgi:hypothetical protein
MALILLSPNNKTLGYRCNHSRRRTSCYKSCATAGRNGLVDTGCLRRLFDCVHTAHFRLCGTRGDGTPVTIIATAAYVARSRILLNMAYSSTTVHTRVNLLRAMNIGTLRPPVPAIAACTANHSSTAFRDTSSGESKVGMARTKGAHRC